jgi:hypothetical protein
LRRKPPPLANPQASLAKPGRDPKAEAAKEKPNVVNL